MFMLDAEPVEDDLVAVELEDEDGVGDPDDELDDRLELPDELFPEELEPLERSSRRESSPERPRRSLPRSPPRSLPRSPPKLRR
jgi:hypothetical protein